MGTSQRAKPMQTPQDALKFSNLGVQLLPDLRVEIVGVNLATVLDTVAESGSDQGDTEAFHQQHDVTVHRRNTSGDRDIEGNGAAVILRHLSGDRIVPNAVLGLKQPEVEAILVVMQRPCGTQPGDPAANNGYAPGRCPDPSVGHDVGSKLFPMAHY